MAVISRTGVIPLSDYPTTTRTFGPIALTDNIASAQLELARCTSTDPTIWPSSTSRLQLELRVSVDGGVSFQSCGGGGAVGGIHTLRDGSQSTSSVIRVDFPATTNRQVLALLDVINGPIRTQGILQLNNPTFNNASSVSGGSVDNLVTGAWAISGSDRALIGGMGWSASSPPNHSTMTWEGSGGTKLVQVSSTVNIGSFGKLSASRLIAPVATTATLYGQITGTADEMCLGGVSFTGVFQSSTAFGNAVVSSQAATTSPFTATATNVSTASGQTVIDMCYSNDSVGGVNTKTVVAGANQTMRWERESVATHCVAGTQSTEEGTSATATMSEAFTASVGGAVNDWGIIAFSIAPTGGVIPSTGAYAQELVSTDRYLLEDGSGVYLIEPWPPASGGFVPGRLWGDLDGLGRFGFKDRLNG